jgi:hypothetical protein
MDFVTYVRSIASFSWIDPRTGLKEVDPRDPGAWTSRPWIRSTLGYRFANFLEAFITVDKSTGYVVGHGFTPASGIYRNLSFAGIPSAFWLPIRSVRLGSDPVVFTQIVGAQTKSAEGIGGALGGPIGEFIAHNVMNFPPIWTELELSMHADGGYHGRVLRHSLFPSMNGYLEYHDPDDRWDIYEPDRNDRYDVAYWQNVQSIHKLNHRYDGVPHYKEWLKNGWGSIRTAGTFGPTWGNPFNVEFTAIDYESWVPKGPADHTLTVP